MVRVTNALSAHRRRKRLHKLAKGFVGDRRNHLRQTKDAVMKALAYNYHHRKIKKRDFRRLWIVRIGVAAKMNGLSYSKLINGLNKAGCLINRKMLSEMAMCDPEAFTVIAGVAKDKLAAA
ncbi:MAG: 50S ribosomal protein L20 [Parachlamydiales bacterium]|nr:50S ribosomal protein L20 [Parachlamydiales bacterium]